MGAFVLFVENEVSSQASAPTAVDIEAVLRSLPVNGNREFKLAAGVPDGAGFVGNARVTRVARVGLPGGRVTRVAWLYQWPDPPGATQAQLNQLYTDVVNSVIVNTSTYLTNSGIGSSWTSTGWKHPVAVPYDPAINGTVDWWTSPTGSVATATRDSFDLNQQLGQNGSIDNPIGPTTAHAPDFDPFNTNNPNGALNKAFDAVTTLAWVIGGVAVLYYVVGPIIQAVVPKSPAR